MHVKKMIRKLNIAPKNKKTKKTSIITDMDMPFISLIHE